MLPKILAPLLEPKYEKPAIIANQRIVIMAAGKSIRWHNHRMPKQLVPVDGEPILHRTIRLLRERGIKDIYVTVRQYGQYGRLNAKEYVNVDQNEFEIDRVWGARELAPCIFLYGDCFYTEKAIDTILSNTNEYRFFGRYENVSRFKTNREIFAIKANNFVIQKATELRQMQINDIIRHSLGGHLAIACVGIEPNLKEKEHLASPQQIASIFTEINDDTDDFDYLIEYRRFLILREQKRIKQAIVQVKQPEKPILKSPPIKTYYSLARMNHDLIFEFLHKIPPEIDLVVGIPRDGLMIAYLISIYRNIPMTDLTSFCAGIIYKPGIKHRSQGQTINTILLIDDICASGLAMKDAKKQIAEHIDGHKLYCAALYVSRPQEKRDLIDFYGCELIGNRSYEWTHGDAVYLPNTIMDIDGILCPDWDGGVDRGQTYEQFLRNAPLRLRPKDIGTLITWRREEHRPITEDWLKQNGINYRELIMARREEWNDAAEFKAYHYQQSDARLLIESSSRQAGKIYSLCRRPVVAFDTNETWGVD